MPGEVKEHIILCRKKDDVAPAKEFIKQQGGELVPEGDLNGTTFVVTLPVDSVSALEASPHIESVELNGIVRTQ